MVNSSLVEYIKKYKDQYGTEYLRTSLIRQGYNPESIDQAIKFTNFKQKNRVFLVLIILLVFFASLFSIFFFWPEEELRVFLELFPEKAVLEKDSLLLFSASFGISADKLKRGVFNYEILDKSGNKLIEDFVFVNVKKQEKKDFYADLKDLPNGDYSLKGVFNVEGRSAESSFLFKIVEEEKAQEVIIKDASCPYSCDDNNPNTIDECIEGRCINNLISNCGNKNCDAGESVFSCPEDCKPKESVNAENLKEKALSFAGSDPEKAAGNCLQLSYGSDECLKDLNEKTKNKEFCKAILDVKIRDSCYSNHVLKTDDFSVCPLIIDSLRKRTCQNLKMLGSAGR